MMKRRNMRFVKSKFSMKTAFLEEEGCLLNQTQARVPLSSPYT